MYLWTLPDNNEASLSKENYAIYMFDVSARRETWAYPKVQQHLIADFVVIYWPPGDEGDNGVDIPPSGVFECMMYFCVKDYMLSVKDGQYSETVISSWPPPNQTLANDTWGDNYAAVDNISTHGSLFALKPPHHDQSYTIDLYTLDLARTWLGGLFTAYIGIGHNPDEAGTPDIAQAFYDEMSTTIGPNQTLFDRIVPTVAPPKSILERICTSMSSHIRSLADGRVAVKGSAHSMQTIVRARWLWAVFPVALLLLTFVFMASAVVLSTAKSVPVWKSSSLAALLHGLDGDACQVLSANRLDEMEGNAAVCVVQLGRDDGRWMLKGSTGSPRS